MAGSLNKVMLIGNLGDDPRITTLNSGDKAATFSVATSEKWKDKNTGEPRERTEWHRVAVYNQGLIKVIGDYMRKGSKVYVEGQLGTRKYTDQSGAERYITEIVLRPYSGEIVLLGDSKAGRAADPDSYGSSRPAASGGGKPPASGGGADFDDDIPF